VTDIELIEKKVAFIEARVRELRELSRPAAIATDVREERFAAYTLQIAVQAALDVATAISREWHCRCTETVKSDALSSANR
jgi:uncharacterized protein YutE (UPF0331/DUF86 family)